MSTRAPNGCLIVVIGKIRVISERAQAEMLAPAPGQPEVARDHLDQRQPRLELVERDPGLISHRQCGRARPGRARAGQFQERGPEVADAGVREADSGLATTDISRR